jgi:hypothetical protein
MMMKMLLFFLHSTAHGAISTFGSDPSHEHFQGRRGFQTLSALLLLRNPYINASTPALLASA